MGSFLPIPFSPPECPTLPGFELSHILLRALLDDLTRFSNDVPDPLLQLIASCVVVCLGDLTKLVKSFVTLLRFLPP